LHSLTGKSVGASTRRSLIGLSQKSAFGITGLKNKAEISTVSKNYQKLMPSI
jgi:hypothetical protein